MMKMEKSKINRIQGFWMILIWIGMWISSICIDYGTMDEAAQTHAIFIVSAVMLGVILLVIAFQKDSFEMAVSVILLLSMWVRFTYCIKMGYNYSNHDLGTMLQDSDHVYNSGHLGYIQYIYNNNRLPDMDPRTVWSYYQPPFFYVVSAIFLKINSLFLSDMRRLFENLQLLTMLFATLTIQTGYKILKEFGIKEKALVGAVAVLAFHPYFIIGGATPNNDILSVLFSFLVVLYSIRWFKQGRLGDIIKIALCIGLGMMTKMSVGLIALPVAVIFLVKFIKEKQWKRYFIQFVIFGVLCIPLGMYWSVRNMHLYDMPLVYVQELPENTNQLIKDIPNVDRVNPFSFTGYDSPFASFQPETTYNMWTALYKTAVFDERNWGSQELPYGDETAYVVLFSWILLTVLSIFMGIYEYFKKHSTETLWCMIFKSLIGIVFLASYIKFCFGFPVICSMNFRYVVPILIVIAINIGLFLDDQKVNRWIKRALGCVVFIFAISSFYLYGVLRL